MSCDVVCVGGRYVKWPSKHHDDDKHEYYDRDNDDGHGFVGFVSFLFVSYHFVFDDEDDDHHNSIGH